MSENRREEKAEQEKRECGSERRKEETDKGVPDGERQSGKRERNDEEERITE